LPRRGAADFWQLREKIFSVARRIFSNGERKFLQWRKNFLVVVRRIWEGGRGGFGFITNQK
jgi:hypothetical protein